MILTLVGILFLMIIYACLIEPRWFRIRKIPITVNKSLAAPLTILHLSDTHFCGYQKYKERFFKRLRHLTPDLVFITGDIIDCNAGIQQAAHFISRIPARLGHFAVLGNHDYFDYHFYDNYAYHILGKKSVGALNPNDVDLLSKTLADHQITLLQNSAVTLEDHNLKIQIFGTDDPVTKKAKMDETLISMHSNALNLLLTHLIDSIQHLPKTQVPDVVFSGHSHGGQVQLPGIGPLIVDTRMGKNFAEGIRSFQGMTLCISRGLSATRTQLFRFLCRPEALWIEIRPQGG